MKKILFVGLGRMGFPMAGHIAKTNEFSVRVCNRSQAKVNAWLSAHKGSALLPEDQFDAIILCIGNDEDVRDALTGKPNLLNKIKTGGVIIDHTTTSEALAQQMHAAAKTKSVAYLDAPVSGGQAGALSGQLTCMVGGDENHLTSVLPILHSYCKNITHIGASGSGQIAKMANQLCIAGTLAGLSEAIQLLNKSHIDTKRVLQAIQGGAAQSWQMDNRFETMTKQEFDFGFAIDHMIKDLKYALQLANQQHWAPVISQQILQWYQNLSEQGHGHQDTSCLVEHYKN